MSAPKKGAEEIRIVPMEERHIKELARLEALCFSSPWSEEGLRAELTSDTAVFLVAEAEEQILGYAGMHMVCGECYVDNIAVFPECRGRGLGRRLTEALIQKGREGNGIFITLEVRPSNEPAVKLYDSLGFQPVGRRKGFYTHPTEDALLMTLAY